VIGKGNDCLTPLYLPIEGYHEKLRVRCGHCINCKIHRASEWCLRLEMEGKYWDDMCFVTLTYNDDNLPKHIIDGHLFYEDAEINEHPELSYIYEPTLASDHLRNFFKRLRKSLQSKIRYYAVGEYGTRFGRPHYHILIFGLAGTLANASLIARCWPFGFVDVKHAFKETAIYVSGYIQKRLYGKDEYLFKLPEFMRCSHHLGERWLMDHLGDFDDDHAYILHNGLKYGIPRTFRKKLVCLGRLSETSQIVLAQRQLEEYAELCKDLDYKGVALSEFFRNRFVIAFEKQKRKLNKRNKTGDI